MIPLVAGAAPSAIAMASALAVAAGAYLNAKLCISTDLENIYHDRAFAKRLSQYITDLDESPTIYKLLERVVELHGKGTSEALWFENKTWTYSQLKDRKNPSSIQKFLPLVTSTIKNNAITDELQWSTASLICCIQRVFELVISSRSSQQTLPKWSSVFRHCQNWAQSLP